MWRPPIQRLAGWLYRHDWQVAGALAVAILAAGAYVLWPRAGAGPAPPAPISAAEVDTAQQSTVIVYVSGAVRSPGLYTLDAGLRVADAIVAAGGMSERADPSCLPNLAAHLKDAKQVTVPFAGRCGKSGKPGKLDLNTATRAQLLAVPGMGAAIADGIIAYREQYGGFTAITELKTALGLDATTTKQLSKALTVP